MRTIRTTTTIHTCTTRTMHTYRLMRTVIGTVAEVLQLTTASTTHLYHLTLTLIALLQQAVEDRSSIMVINCRERFVDDVHLSACIFADSQPDSRRLSTVSQSGGLQRGESWRSSAALSPSPQRDPKRRRTESFQESSELHHSVPATTKDSTDENGAERLQDAQHVPEVAQMTRPSTATVTPKPRASAEQTSGVPVDARTPVRAVGEWGNHDEQSNRHTESQSSGESSKQDAGDQQSGGNQQHTSDQAKYSSESHTSSNEQNTGDDKDLDRENDTTEPTTPGSSEEEQSKSEEESYPAIDPQIWHDYRKNIKDKSYSHVGAVSTPTQHQRDMAIKEIRDLIGHDDIVSIVPDAKFRE